MIAPALITLAGSMVLLGEFDEGERWLRRADLALRTDTGPDIRLLLHQTAGMLHAGRSRHAEALQEFGAAHHLASQLAGSQALASQMTGWRLATQARLGLPAEARAALAALDDEQAGSGEIRNARAAICLAEGDPAGALEAVREVLDGTAPALGYVTIVEAHLLAGLAHHELGDERAANQAVEQALALVESDRVVLPFAMTGARKLLQALPRHQTAHGALLADILDVLHGAAAVDEQLSLRPAEELSPGELRVLRFLPTNLSRPEIADQLSVSLNTVSRHLRRIYPAPAQYLIRINGHLGATVLSAFPTMAPRQHGAHTVLTGSMDRSALFGVLAEIEALGLDLHEIRKLTPNPAVLRTPESP